MGRNLAQQKGSVAVQRTEELRYRSRNGPGLRVREAQVTEAMGKPVLPHGTTLGPPFPLTTIIFLSLVESDDKNDAETMENGLAVTQKVKHGDTI